MKPVPALSKIRLISAMLLLLTPCLHAQHILNRTVSLSVKDIPLSDMLDSIGQKGRFFFSFQTAILPLQKKVSLDVTHMPVAVILEGLLGDGYTFSEQGQYLILREAVYFTLSGRLTDSLSGAALEQATVSVQAQDKEAVTDATGAFTLRLLKDGKTIVLMVRKMGYVPVLVSLKAHTAALVLGLQPQAVALPTVEIAYTQRSPARRGPGNMFRLNTPGIKMGGLFNVNNGAGSPLQLAFAVNVAGKSYKGLQLTSVHNIVKDTMAGMQVSGLINKAEGDMHGLQFSAFNYARSNKGLQIGAVNISDSSNGYSLGLLNVVKGISGYRRVSLFTNDIVNTGISLKTGNAKLYNIWMFGINLQPGQKMMAIGLGLGHDFVWNRKLKLATQAAYHVVWCGMGFENRLAQFKLLPEYRLNRSISLFGGLTANWYKNRNYGSRPGYKNITGITADMDMEHIGKTKTWIGWELGLTYDPPYNCGETVIRPPGNWNLSIGIGLGLASRRGFSDPVKSIAIRTEKYIFDDIAFTLTAGYSQVNYYNLRILPLTAGLKVFQGQYLYVAAEAGAALLDFNKVCLVLAPAAGVNYKNKIDLSLRSDFYGSGDIHVGLRLAYGLGFP